MTFAEFATSRFDEPHWRARCAAEPLGFVACTAELARVAAEHAYGRAFTVHAFQAERHFEPCLIVPTYFGSVTGGQARGPWALVPAFDAAFGRLIPLLWRRHEASGAPARWVKVAAFRDNAVAISATRPLHLAPHWLTGLGEVDARIVERVLVADGFVPGRVPGSSLGHRVYDWRRS